MAAITMIEDLYRANDWAHEKLFRLCGGLTDEQLDQKRELGLGSLRATLFHILAAEEIWYERWTGQPTRPFPIDPEGIPLAEIESRLKRIAGLRQQLMDSERGSQWQRVFNYVDFRGNPQSRRLADILLHVANHGVHHRAQASSFLKGFGRSAVIGIDYLFYKLSRPSVPQSAEAIEALRQQGIEMATGPGDEPAWDAEVMKRYFAYHDWATGKLLDLALPLPDAALDRDFKMGPGSLRKTIVHLHDVEPFWLSHWAGTPGAFNRTPEGTPLARIKQTWSETASRRNELVARTDAAAAAREVSVSFGGPAMKFRVIEAMLQVCGHGTYHRAQIVNMLRHSGVKAPGLDFPVYLTEIGQ